MLKYKDINQKQPQFNSVSSRNNLPKIKDGIYVINQNKYKSTRTHWIALYVNGDNFTYFDSFGVQHIPKKQKIHRQQSQPIFLECKQMIQ